MSSARLLLLAIALTPDISSAASPRRSPIPVQLEVRSALNCASRANLVERVRARSPRIEFVDNAGEVVIGVTFSRQGEVFAGELAWLEADKPTRVRRFDAGSCEQAVDAVALILAITLDPDAAMEGDARLQVADPTPAGVTASESASPPPVSEPNGSSTRGAGAANATLAVPAQRTKTDLQERSRIGEAAEPDAAPRRVGGWVFTGGIGGELGVGAAPFGMPGIAAFTLFGPTTPSLLGPTFVLSGAWSWSPTSRQPEGSADFELGTVSVDVCPSRFSSANLRFDTCIGGSLGRFSASGADVLNAATVARPLPGAGLTGLVQLDVTEHFALLLRVAPQVNLLRDEFEFGHRVFHRVPPFALHVNFGIATRISAAR